MSDAHQILLITVGAITVLIAIIVWLLKPTRPEKREPAEYQSTAVIYRPHHHKENPKP